MYIIFYTALYIPTNQNSTGHLTDLSNKKEKIHINFLFSEFFFVCLVWLVKTIKWTSLSLRRKKRRKEKLQIYTFSSLENWESNDVGLILEMLNKIALCSIYIPIYSTSHISSNILFGDRSLNTKLLEPKRKKSQYMYFCVFPQKRSPVAFYNTNKWLNF